ncbi:sugar ABC transporter permease [Martelella lutilitoris]|uniref:Sugar ABC transporter permease n=1 Tax=Martelella lutilitoris TaxID=2583532 RepID=A0A7T7KKY5_9HYPH|nr:sugar ABC transporter permease [Martelella lutilitoris]QQM30003.1 sugar ABC transporter permease [Martelella lutilitoris]
MKNRANGLGLVLMAPAVLLLIAFFLLPATLTGIFAFTNMSTSTGISGGAYVVTETVLRKLEATDLDPKLRAGLGEKSYTVNAETLAAATSADIEPGFLAEIEDRLSGKTYAASSAFEDDLKSLPSRPRRIRDLKLATEPFERSVINTRYPDRGQFEAALQTFLPAATKADLETIATASYTGWTWTRDNFIDLFTRADTLRLVANTVFYVCATLAFNVFVGLFLAIAVFYLPSRAGGVFNVLWLLPRITPVVLYAIMWKWFTWENGFLYVAAEDLGLPAFNYMKGSVPTAWATVILVNGFVGASFGMILFSGALRAIPIQQLWSSEVDGANRWQQVTRIILPQMRWPILFVTSYQTLSLLSSYELIWLTTNGGPGSTTTVWSLEAFHTALNNYTGNLQYGLGAAMALILVIVGLALSILYLRLFRFNELVSKPKIEF